MAEIRSVLSIAGFDPSGGAGILADIKTFEAHKVSGMAVLSALTFQNDAEFDGVQWISPGEIVKQIALLQRRFEFSFIKIGLIENLETLEAVFSCINPGHPELNVIWDPVIKASAGFEFHKNLDREKLAGLLKKCLLITPNTDEVKFLAGNDDPLEAAKELSSHCNVLLKGGHNETEPGVDYLVSRSAVEKILPSAATGISQKHGSGCVLSAAIAANLAQGHDLLTSCRNGKKYTEQFLASSSSLLGVHYA